MCFQFGFSCGAIVTPEIFGGSVANIQQLERGPVGKPFVISFRKFCRDESPTTISEQDLHLAKFARRVAAKDKRQRRDCSDEVIHSFFCCAMDCFAEPVIGRRFAPTRWFAMTWQPIPHTGRAIEYFTWLSAKLDSIEAMPSSRVSLFFKNAS